MDFIHRNNLRQTVVRLQEYERLLGQYWTAREQQQGGFLSARDVIDQEQAYANLRRQIERMNVALRQQEEIQKANLRALEQQFRNISQFKIFEPSGKLTHQYQQYEKTHGSGTGSTQALSDFQRQITTTQALMEKANVPLAVRAQVNASLQQQLSSLRQEVQAQNLVRQAAEKRQEVERDINNLMTRRNTLLGRQTQTETSVRETVAKINQALTVNEQSLGRFQNPLSQTTTPTPVTVGPGGGGANEAGRAWNRLLQAQTAVRTSLAAYQKDSQNPATRQAIQQTTEAYFRQFQALSRISSTGYGMINLSHIGVGQNPYIATSQAIIPGLGTERTLRNMATGSQQASAYNVRGYGAQLNTAGGQLTGLDRALAENSAQLSKLAGPEVP